MISYIETISMLHFRNLASTTLSFNASGACFVGENGSGKTSLLEALYYLGYGKSFRTQSAKQVVQYHHLDFCLHAKVCHHHSKIAVGLERTYTGVATNKLSGCKQPTTADLALNLPIILVNPDSYVLLHEGALFRRQFLDWGVFHVEHGFYPAWLRFSRLLKQRNTSLKQGASYSDLAAWDYEFAHLSEFISLARERYFNALLVLVNDFLAGLVNVDEVFLQYSAGWDQSEKLLTILERSYQKDLDRGFTYYGAQRADIHIKVGKFFAADVLSRGQQKLLVIALRLAQGLLLKQLTGKSTIYLLDDITAELDSRHTEYVFSWLNKIKAQCFLTLLNAGALEANAYLNVLSRFHVEQGVVTPASA
jgi:DNA replication and repair protein RecF